MRLLSLSTLNFMPYKGETTLAFPLDAARNVMVVFGDNMRGKTSILNALRWAFYGRALGRHLREIPLHEMINKEATSESDWVMEARVRFEAGGHQYDLRRRATKRALVALPSRPADYEVVVGLQKDGMAVSGHLVEAEINRYAPEQVSRFFLFDGELLQEYESLLIEGSEPGRRIKEAIEQVLGVPTLVNGRDEVATLLKDAQKQQSRDLQHVQGLERQAEKQATWQTKQEALESDLRDLKVKLGNTKAERQRLDDDLEKVDAVHSAKMRLDFLSKRRKEIDDKQKSLVDERLVLLRDSWRDLLKPKLVVRQRFLVAEQERITEQYEEKVRLETRATDLRGILETSTCPTCRQPLPEAERLQAGKALGDLEVSLRAHEFDSKTLATVSAEIKEISRLITPGVGSKIRAVDSEMRRLGVELTQVENESEQLSDNIKGYDTAEIARKRTLRDGYIREEGKIERDIGDSQKKLEETKRELAIIAKALQNIPQARASRSTAMVKVCMALERAFNGSIERLRDDLRKDVAARATDAFLSLTTQRAYKKLDINENYGLNIVDDTGGYVTVRSAGAEQIVALSLIDGLARTGRSAGPVVMDTPFGRLDLKHRDNILRYLPTTTSQLVLLVHDGEIRRDIDLQPIADKIGASYEIKEVNPRHSRIEKVKS